MILLVKSLNKSFLWNIGFKHRYFVDTKKNLVYSYDYEIKWDNFINGKVKTFTFSAYDKEIKWDVEIIKLPHFDLDKYLDYSNDNSTCMDFCLYVMNKENIPYNMAIESYFEVKKDIKNITFSHFLSFWLWWIFWILLFLVIIQMFFNLHFNFI